jgi:hypothetical protein
VATRVIEVSCGAAGIVRAGLDVVCPDAIAGKPAPTGFIGVCEICELLQSLWELASQLPQVLLVYAKSANTRNYCGNWLASDPPQAAIKKRHRPFQPTAFFFHCNRLNRMQVSFVLKVGDGVFKLLQLALFVVSRRSSMRVSASGNTSCAARQT